METAPPVFVSTTPRGNDKMWSIFCHLSGIMGITGLSFILPLVVYLVMRNESEYVAANAKEALNFHISLLIYVVISAFLCLIFIGIPMLVAIGIGSLILSILAAVKASDGLCYHYPLTIRFF